MDLALFTRAGRVKSEGAFRGRQTAEGPASVRRQKARGPFSELHQRGAIRLADACHVVWASLLVLLVEQDHLPILGDVRDKGPVDPRELAFLRLAGRLGGDTGPHAVPTHEHLAILRNIEQAYRAGETGDGAQLSARFDRVKRA